MENTKGAFTCCWGCRCQGHLLSSEGVVTNGWESAALTDHKAAVLGLEGTFLAALGNPGESQNLAYQH